MRDLPDPKPKAEDPATLGPTSKLDVQRSMFDVFPLFRWFKEACDYLGGSREEPPAGAAFLASPWWSGIWWGILAALILLFCGQTSKFIYIDF